MIIDKQVIMQPENRPKKYEALFLEIDSGEIKLPMFQRDFVWDKEQTAKLIDSILKGFPIGTFIFWKTRDRLRSYKDIGNHRLPDTPKGEYANYILDGQQRITSLYAIRKGIRITRDGKEINYRDIYIDLEYDAKKDEQIVISGKPTRNAKNGNEKKNCISVHDVLTCSMIDLEDDYTRDDRKLIDTYQKALTRYDFSTIVIKDYPIEIACEIFSRINTGGKVLSVFEIMVAKTYDESQEFDLAEQYDILRDGSDDNDKECLRAAKFETIPATVVMQSVAAIKTKQVRSKDILKMKREDFIESWQPMKDAIFESVDFLRHKLRIPVSQILPYSSILVPFTYFFHKTKNKKPTSKQCKLLEQWFYWVGLNNRYSSATETKMGEDLLRMDKIILEEEPQYPKDELHVDYNEFVEEWTFSAGDAACKTILCLLVFHQPKSFDSNSIVNLDNSNLKIATSKNYHHFFPKAYLAKNNKSAEPNLMANITLIDGYSNKHMIGKKPPSLYIAKFAKDNLDIKESLKSHLIGDPDDFGISNDNYETFIEERSRALAKILNKKLMPFRHS